MPATPVILLTGWGHQMLADGAAVENIDRVVGKLPKLRELRAILAQTVFGARLLGRL